MAYSDGRLRVLKAAGNFHHGQELMDCCSDFISDLWASFDVQKSIPAVLNEF